MSDLKFDIMPGTGYHAGPLEDGTRVGVDIGDVMTTGPHARAFRDLRLSGTLHDIVRLRDALTQAIKQANQLAALTQPEPPLDAQSAMASEFYSDEGRAHECQLGPGVGEYCRCPPR